MNNLYGFRESDVIAFLDYLKTRKEEPLSVIFQRFAQASKKAKGTVRNLYYTVCRLSQTDVDFRKRFLDGKMILVEKKEEFTPCQERALLRQILLKKQNGCSVRKAVFDIAKGDAKLSLRYQNKFRSLIKTKPQLVNEIVEQIKKETGKSEILVNKNSQIPNINKIQMGRLKKEINSLFERTFINLRKENAVLKEENAKLKRENISMSKALFGTDKTNSVVNFFLSGDKKGLLS